MILDEERLHELRFTHISLQARPAAEIAARARQLRRRRRVTSVTVVTAAVALVCSAVTWGLPNPAPAPAAGPRFGPPPWPVPTAPYRALYEDVRVSFPGSPAACGNDHAVDLRDPAGDAPAAGDAVLTIRPGCTNPPTGATVAISAPKARLSSGTGQQRIGPRVTADDCFNGMRNLAMAGSETVLQRWPDGSPESRRLADLDVPAGMEMEGPVQIQVQNLTQCVLVAPDPSRDLPLAMVRIELVLRDDRGIDATFTAWRGGPPVLVRPMEWPPAGR
jgi:hypothetical protein